jgi:rhodanese-related sulfurtransferase
VADRIIKKDPSLMLVDVRSENLFREFTLAGAVNIPLEKINDPENTDLLTQPGYDIVFFSNGDVQADQAWIICKRKKFESIFVMEGGLNRWFEVFFMAQRPAETASGEEIALYQFRSAVRQYFTGEGVESVAKPATEKITVTPKKKKSAAEGGC